MPRRSMPPKSRRRHQGSARSEHADRSHWPFSPPPPSAAWRGCLSIRCCRGKSRRRTGALPWPSRNRPRKRQKREGPAQRAASKSRSSLKELEAQPREAEQDVASSVRMQQAGLDWSTQKFFVIFRDFSARSFVCRARCSWARGILGAVGPCRRRRLRPAALGLWLSCASAVKSNSSTSCPTPSTSSCAASRPACRSTTAIRIIASERAEPVRSEFRAIIETQAIGIPLGEACDRDCPSACRCPRRISSPSSSPSSRRPAAISPRRSATSRGAARPQEDERQDQAHVDGSQGLRRDHRRAAVDRHAPRLPLEPGLHHRCCSPSRSATHSRSAAASGCRSASW